MAARVTQRVMRGVEGLNDDAPRRPSSSAPPRHLRQHLKRFFRGAEVRHIQRCIGGDNAHQGDGRKIVPLGDHLRPHQDVDFAAFQRGQNLFLRSPARRGIGIHAADARLRKQALQFGFQFLRARTVVEDSAAAAPGAERHGPAAVIAVVAFYDIFRRMAFQGNRAVGAGKGVAAVGADQKCIESALVEKKKRLLPAVQGAPKRRDQRIGENRRFAAGSLLHFHVHDVDARQRLAVDPLGQFQVRVFSGAGIEEGAHARRR